MRRLVAIHIKGGVAVSLWVLGAWCVAAEVRQPGFWYDNVNRVAGKSGDHPSPRTPRGPGAPGDRAIGSSGHLNTNTSSQSSEGRSSTEAGPEPAYQDPRQNNEVAAEQQASELPAQEPPQQSANDSHVRQIVISIPDRRLALLIDGELAKVYPVAVGKDETPSPEGEFTIVNHSVDPTYRHGDTEIGPGKDNPLGTRWMGLSLKGYGIHGTNVQSSVGKAASHGCFRMKKKDVEDLYRRVQVGDAVSIRGERDELTASLFGTGEVKRDTEVASATAVSAPAGGEQ